MERETKDFCSNRLNPSLDDDLKQLVLRLGVLRCQLHKCNRTCFKNGHKSCRFHFPRETVEQSGITADGQLKLRRSAESSWINNYVQVCTFALRCNVDAKLVAGSARSAIMSEYVTKYATKHSEGADSTIDVITQELNDYCDGLKATLVRSNVVDVDANGAPLPVSAEERLARAADNNFKTRLLLSLGTRRTNSQIVLSGVSHCWRSTIALPTRITRFRFTLCTVSR